jgi:hypothetical protein
VRRAARRGAYPIRAENADRAWTRAPGEDRIDDQQARRIYQTVQQIEARAGGTHNLESAWKPPLRLVRDAETEGVVGQNLVSQGEQTDRPPRAGCKAGGGSFRI